MRDSYAKDGTRSQYKRNSERRKVDKERDNEECKSTQREKIRKNLTSADVHAGDAQRCVKRRAQRVRLNL